MSNPAGNAYNPNYEQDPATFHAGSVEETSRVNARKEDLEADYSERTGVIPQSEVNDLRGNEVLNERTRGVKNDAYKQERNLDAALEQENPEIVNDDLV